MTCPKCGTVKTEVLDSRKIQKLHGSVRRRRVCNKCFHCWTTYEIQQKYVDSILGKIKNERETIQELYERTQSLNQILTRDFGGDLADPADRDRGDI